MGIERALSQLGLTTGRSAACHPLGVGTSDSTTRGLVLPVVPSISTRISPPACCVNNHHQKSWDCQHPPPSRSVPFGRIYPREWRGSFPHCVSPREKGWVHLSCKITFLRVLILRKWLLKGLKCHSTSRRDMAAVAVAEKVFGEQSRSLTRLIPIAYQ